jgi:hypothetical protein
MHYKDNPIRRAWVDYCCKKRSMGFSRFKKQKDWLKKQEPTLRQIKTFSNKWLRENLSTKESRERIELLSELSEIYKYDDDGSEILFYSNLSNNILQEEIFKREEIILNEI